MSFNKWPSVQYKYLLFFETTIMGNTVDLAMVQKTIIDTPHTEGKSQRGITERGCCIKAYLNAKLTGRKKMCTSNRDECKLENTVKQSRFKHLGELATEAGVHQESPLCHQPALLKKIVTN